MNSASTQSKSSLIYILWGDGFDSATASVFASACREKALGTKLVSVRGKNHTGIYGIKLTPDWTLGKAMTESFPALAYIIPSPVGSYAKAENDPRLFEFLQTCYLPSTRLVVQNQMMLTQPSIGQLHVKPEQITVYGEWSNLPALMDGIIRRLLSYSG